MGRQNQSGQVLIEAMAIFLVFSAILIVIQGLMDRQTMRSNKYKLSKEVKNEIHSSPERK